MDLAPSSASSASTVSFGLGAPDLFSILDSLPALVSYIDRDLVYRFNNRAYETWFGHARGEVTGQSVRNVLGEAAFEALRPHLERALAGHTVEFHLRVPYQKGGTREVRATYMPHRSGDGVVLGFVVHVQDRTPEVEARKALDLANAQLEEKIEERTRELAAKTEFLGTILDAASDLGEGVILLDGPRITYANDAFLAMVGRPRADVLAMTSTLDLSAPEQREAIRERWQRRARGEPIASTFESILQRPDGTIVEVEVMSKEMGGGRALSLLRDISMRKRLERNERQQRVARGIVRKLFAHLTSDGRSGYQVRREIGRSLAAGSGDEVIEDPLEGFAAMGLGELRVISEKGGRHEFRGRGLIDCAPRSTTPTCGLALGYLEGLVGAKTGREALGAETACQAQGAPECTFVVRER